MKLVFGWLLDHVVAFRHQLFETHAGLVPPVGIECQLEPAFVVEIERIEKRLRFGDVNQHRRVVLRAHLPHRIQLRIVHFQTAAVGLPREHAEVLEHLQGPSRRR
jgi:hypothetical protein